MITAEDMEAMADTPNSEPPKDPPETVEASEPNPPFWNVDQIRRLWSSGFVRRWHCNPDARLRNAGDMNGGHTQRVAILYMGLFMHLRNTHEMLAAHCLNLMVATLHDAPEALTGDIPQPGKARLAALRDGDKAGEAVFWETLAGAGVNWSKKSPMVALCDLLDAILFAKVHAPELMSTEAWGKDIETCLRMADELGVHQEVWELIHEEWSLL